MRKKCNKMYTDYKFPIPFADPEIEDLQVVVNVYVQKVEKQKLENAYRKVYRNQCLKDSVSNKHGILHTNWAVLADKDDRKILNEIMEAKSVEHGSKRTISRKDARETKDIAARDDGSVRT